jgi:hypothetical protein
MTSCGSELCRYSQIGKTYASVEKRARALKLLLMLKNYTQILQSSIMTFRS